MAILVHIGRAYGPWPYKLALASNVSWLALASIKARPLALKLKGFSLKLLPFKRHQPLKAAFGLYMPWLIRHVPLSGKKLKESLAFHFHSIFIIN